MLFNAVVMNIAVSIFLKILSIMQWTLIARFSNNDSRHWINDAVFWYDRDKSFGEVNNSLGNDDMISSSFWELNGSEMKITRSDDSSHTALLQTTSNCLEGNINI